jgi:YVTN family beta-propeller protein
VGAGGEEIALEPLRRELSIGDHRYPVLLARGRIAAGQYAGFALRGRGLAAGTAPDLRGAEAGTKAGAVPEARVEFAFTALPRRTTLVFLSPRPGPPGEPGVAFTAAAADRSRAGATTSVLGYASIPDSHHLAIFDKRAARLVGVVPTGRAPQGIAVDPVSNRAFVALSGEDAVSIFDLAAEEELARVRLSPGDAPGELALTPDRSLLVVVNARSDTVSLVDPRSGVELHRLPTGEEPRALLMDRGGRGAYVLNYRSNTMTVLDLVGRSVVSTVATEEGPLRAQASRAGDRLYVVHEGSPNLVVYRLPDLTVLARAFVGLDAQALKVDPRTGLIYVAGERRVQVLDPTSLVAVHSFEVGGAVSYLAIDDGANRLVLVIPSRRALAFAEVGGRPLPMTLEFGAAPGFVALVGERQ